MKDHTFDDAILFPDASDKTLSDLAQSIGSVMSGNATSAELEDMHKRIVDRGDTFCEDICLHAREMSMLMEMEGDSVSIDARKQPITSVGRWMNTAVSLGNLHYYAFDDREGLNMSQAIAAMFSMIMEEPDEESLTVIGMDALSFFRDFFAKTATGGMRGMLDMHVTLGAFMGKEEWKDGTYRRSLAENTSPEVANLVSLNDVNEWVKGGRKHVSDLSPTEAGRLGLSSVMAKNVINAVSQSMNLYITAMRALVPKIEGGGLGEIVEKTKAMYGVTPNVSRYDQILSHAQDRFQFLTTVCNNTYAAMTNGLQVIASGSPLAPVFSSRSTEDGDSSVVRKVYVEHLLKGISQDGGGELIRIALGPIKTMDAVIDFLKDKHIDPEVIRSAIIDMADATQAVHSYSEMVAEETGMVYTHSQNGKMPISIEVNR